MYTNSKHLYLECNKSTSLLTSLLVWFFATWDIIAKKMSANLRLAEKVETFKDKKIAI